MVAAGALKPNAPNVPGVLMTAARAPETLRPPQADQELPARFLGRETLLEFQQVARIVFHGAPRYPEAVPESRTYPFPGISTQEILDFSNRAKYTNVLCFFFVPSTYFDGEFISNIF